MTEYSILYHTTIRQEQRAARRCHEGAGGCQEAVRHAAWSLRRPYFHRPPSGRSYISKGIYDSRAVALSVRNSYVSTLCPVVRCPYLYTSEAGATGFRHVSAPSLPPSPME